MSDEERIRVNFSVTGEGDSLWGDSDGVYQVTTLEIDHVDDKFVSINVFVPNTECGQYTDTRIPDQILEQIRAILEKRFG